MIGLPQPRIFHTAVFDEKTRLTAGDIPLAERLAMVDNMHVDNPSYEEGFEFVKHQHFPGGGDVVGKASMKMLVGDYRSGKTRIIERYAADENGRRADRKRTPVLHIECMSNWSAKNVMIAVIEQLTLATQSSRPSLDLLTKLAMHTLRLFQVELLVIDDVGWIVDNGTKYARDLLTNLRNLQKVGFFNIRLVGPAATHRTIETGQDSIGCLPHHEVIGMDWYGGGQDEYVMYLDDLDDLLPFREKSGLGAYAPYFYDLSKGSPAFTGIYVADAAHRAFRDGADKIEHRHLVAMGVKMRSLKDTFTPFVDGLPEDMVGLRKLPE